MRYEDFTQTTSRNLKMLRRAQGLAQSELASSLGVSRSTYWAMERGDRPLTLYQAVTFCKLLHIRFTDLYDPDLTRRLYER